MQDELPEVKPDQLWIDNDARNRATRYLRVHSVDSRYAYGASWYDEPGALSRSFRIALNRFNPNRQTGYRLAENQEIGR